jgi:hypothetical protein
MEENTAGDDLVGQAAIDPSVDRQAVATVRLVAAPYSPLHPDKEVQPLSDSAVPYGLRAGAAAAVLTAGSVVYRTRTQWRESVDRAMSQRDHRWTKTARLRRRLRN